MAVCHYPWIGYLAALLIAWTVIFVVRTMILPILQCMAYSYFAGKKERSVPTLLRGIVAAGAIGGASAISNAEDSLCKSTTFQVGEQIPMVYVSSRMNIPPLPDGTASLTFTFSEGNYECAKVLVSNSSLLYVCMAGEISELQLQPDYLFQNGVDVLSESVERTSAHSSNSKRFENGVCVNEVVNRGPDCGGCRGTYAAFTPSDQCSGGCVYAESSGTRGILKYQDLEDAPYFMATDFLGAVSNPVVRIVGTNLAGVIVWTACASDDNSQVISGFDSRYTNIPSFLKGYSFDSTDPGDDTDILAKNPDLRISISTDTPFPNKKYFISELPPYADRSWGPVFRWQVPPGTNQVPPAGLTSVAQCAILTTDVDRTCRCVDFYWIENIKPEPAYIYWEVPVSDPQMPLSQFLGGVVTPTTSDRLANPSVVLDSHGTTVFTIYVSPGAFTELVDPIMCIDVDLSSAQYMDGATDLSASATFNFTYTDLCNGTWTETLMTSGKWGKVSAGQSLIAGVATEIEGVFNISQNSTSVEFTMAFLYGNPANGIQNNVTFTLILQGVPHIDPPTPTPIPNKKGFDLDGTALDILAIVITVLIIIAILVVSCICVEKCVAPPRVKVT